MKFQGKIGGELTGRISGMRLVLTSRLSKGNTLLGWSHKKAALLFQNID